MEKATIRFVVFSKGLPIGGANVKLCLEVEKFKIEVVSALTDRVGYGKLHILRDTFDKHIKAFGRFTDANVFDLLMEVEGCRDETKKLLRGNSDELFEFIATESKTLLKLFVSGTPELAENGKISTPDLIDYQLSPNSFLLKSNVKIGDTSGCEHIVPSTLPLREYSFFRVCVVDNVTSTHQPGSSLPSVRDKVSPETEIKWGYISEFKQTWFSLGHSLGEIKYSLALAPGEAVKIAVVDWRRKDDANRTAGNQSKEFLSHDQTVTRDIDDIVSGKIHENQSGHSFMAGFGSGASVPLEGISLSGQQTLGGGFTHTEGVRDFVSNSHQAIHNQVVQDSSLVRSQNSSVVIQATQEESSFLSTRIVANMNRGHALSVLYYEILRHFGVLTEFVKLHPCVLIPVSLIEFDIETVKRYRNIIEPSLLDDSLSKAFDTPSSTIIPSNSNVTDNSAMTAIGFEITFTTEWQWDGNTYVPPADTGGQIELDLNMDDGAVIKLVRVGVLFVQKQFQHINNYPADFPGWKTTFEVFDKNEAGRTISTYITIAPNVDISKISDIVLRWDPYKILIKDRWNLTRLRIVAKTNKSDFTVLDHSHSSTPQLFPSASSIKQEEQHFSPTKPTLSSVPGVAAPIVPPPPPPGSTNSGEKVTFALLIEHLNNNSFYYSEKIWMLMDPKERRLRLNKFAGGILSKTSDQPLGMSGNHLAFPYFGTVPSYVHKASHFEEGVANTESIVALPTRGIFAEAHLGHCNAAEERDITRYWAFDELPVSLLPNIDNLSASSRFQQPNLTADTILASGLTIQPQTNLPNPGDAIAKALELLGKPDIFRDMSAKKEVADVIAKLIESTKPQTIIAERKSSSSSEGTQVRPSTSSPSQPKLEGSEEGTTMLDVDKFKGSLINPKDFFDGTKAMESWLSKADITKEEKSDIRKRVVKPKPSKPIETNSGSGFRKIHFAIKVKKELDGNISSESINGEFSLRAERDLSMQSSVRGPITQKETKQLGILEVTDNTSSKDIFADYLPNGSYLLRGEFSQNNILGKLIKEFIAMMQIENLSKEDSLLEDSLLSRIAAKVEDKITRTMGSRSIPISGCEIKVEGDKDIAFEIEALYRIKTLNEVKFNIFNKFSHEINIGSSGELSLDIDASKVESFSTKVASLLKGLPSIANILVQLLKLNVKLSGSRTVGNTTSASFELHYSPTYVDGIDLRVIN